MFKQFGCMLINFLFIPQCENLRGIKENYCTSLSTFGKEGDKSAYSICEQKSIKMCV